MSVDQCQSNGKRKQTFLGFPNTMSCEIPDQKTTTIMDLFSKGLILKHGATRKLISGNVRNRSSKVVEKVCAKLGIKRLSARHTIVEVMAAPDEHSEHGEK